MTSRIAPRYSNVKFAALMDAQGRRSTWLAGVLGVDPSYISKIKKGDKPLTEALAQKVAPILGVRPDYFLADDPTEAQR